MTQTQQPTSLAHNPAIPAPLAFAFARSLWPTLLLVAAVTAARLAYVLWFCPYQLIEDEAHYWEWSRHVALSYYSKGPGIAWTIAATTRLLGDTEAGVRIAAPVFGAITALCAAGLARDVWASTRAAFVAAALILLLPGYQVTSLLMTIDGPYVAMWAIAAWAGYRALYRASRFAWPALGLALAAAILYKYTALLLVPAIIASALLDRRRLLVVRPAAPWALAAVVIAATAFIPILVWNAAEGWPTVHHLIGHLGLRGGDQAATQGVRGWHYDPLWTLEYLGTQAGFVLFILGLIASAVLTMRRGGDDAPPGARYLIVCGAVMLGFYFCVTFIAETEGNWPIAAYVTLVSLAAGHVVRELDRYRTLVAAWRATPEPRKRAGLLRRRPETAVQILWHATIAAGLISGLGMLRPDVLAAAPGVGKYVPIGRLRGADVQGAAVAEHVESLRSAGAGEPFVLVQHYGQASRLAFYIPGRPVVYCASSFTGGRKTQYDLWPHTDLANQETAAKLQGRPAVCVGATLEQWMQAFDRVEDIGPLRGEHKVNRHAFIGFGYHGFARRAAP